MKRRLCAVLSLTALLLVGASAQASSVLVIGNMPGNDGTSTFVNSVLGGDGPYDSKAAGFTMGSTSLVLDSVDIRMDLNDRTAVPVLEIWSDVGGVPGAPLLTLDSPAFGLPGSTGTYSFTAGSHLTLAAGTTYWVLATNASPVASSWRWRASSPGVSPTGAYATDAGYLFDFGAPPPTSASAVFNSYAVNASAIPEPGSLALLGLGIVRVGLARRKRRKHS